MHYLTIVGDEIHYQLVEGSSVLAEEVVASIAEYNELAARLRAAGVSSLMCSSSMDFPEDSTDDADTIALANLIRSAGPSGDAPVTVS